MCGALPCRSGADPPSSAALHAATRPSIRRCAAVRVSSCPAGGLNASAAVRTISYDTASPSDPDNTPVLSRVSPNDKCRLSQRFFSRSSAAPGSAR